MLVRGTVVGETVEKYYLFFRNTILESGTQKEIEWAIGKILRDGKANLGKYLERLFFIKTGTGGGFKYLTEVTSAKMVCQEQPMSCAAACIRQIAKDHGKLISEEVARTAAKTHAGGTALDNIGPGLQKILPDAMLIGGFLKIPGLDDTAKLAEVIDGATSHPWIVTLKPVNGPFHTVIIDKIADGIVYIRDPWGVSPGYGVASGMEATMKLEDFARIWTQHAVYITKI